MATSEDLKKIAQLAKLSMDAEEETELIENVAAILDYVNKLESVNVEDIEAMSHVHGTTNVFREDEAALSIAAEEFLKSTPETSDTFIKVPIIIEQEN